MNIQAGDLIIAEEKGVGMFGLLLKRDGRLVSWSGRDERECIAIEFDGLVAALRLVAKLSDLKMRLTKKEGWLEIIFFE